MKNKLTELYRLINKDVETVYVFPRIEQSSKFNPYLKLLYNDFLSNPEDIQGIRIKSPHPLLPEFILKKIFGEKSIVHYHFMDFSDVRGLFVLIWKLKLILFYKLLGGKIVWSVHNKQPHSKGFINLNIFFYRVMAKLSTKLHVHSKEAACIMTPILKVNENKFFVIKHPLYHVTLVPQKVAQEYIQKKLLINIDTTKPVFLIYGYIAEYKGILEIIPLFIENNIQLIIAGKCKKGEDRYFQKVNTMVQNKQSIYLIAQFLSQENEMYLFNAADFVVFNLKNILSSGSVMLAISYKKKVLIPDTGDLKELSGPDIYKFHTLNEFKQLLETIIENFSPKKQ